MFNGTDLTGWKANNDPDSFAVKDKVLHVRASGKTSAHLSYIGDRPAVRAMTRVLRYVAGRA